MKTLKYLAICLAGASLLAGCSDDEQPGKGNKDKERPEVNIVAGKVTTSQNGGNISVNAPFSITVSDDARQYGYAVLPGSESGPDAYSILVGEVADPIASGTFSCEAGGGARAHSFSVTVGKDEAFGDYTIYAAAITETGLTSEVAAVTIPASEIPKPEDPFAVPRGAYEVHYKASATYGGKPVESTHSGTPFVLGLSPYDGIGAEEGLYVLAGEWFNMGELWGGVSTIHPCLVGRLDRERLTITFDRMLDPSTVNLGRPNWKIYDKGTPYNTAFSDYVASDGSGDIYMFRGGTSGDAPVVVTLDKSGKPLTLSICAYARVKQETKEIVAYYDVIGEPAELVYRP